jgi:hypothetical protein
MLPQCSCLLQFLHEQLHEPADMTGFVSRANNLRAIISPPLGA